MNEKFELKKLEEVCDVFADGDWVESKDQSPKGIRLIQTGNIGEGFFKDRGEKARYISEATFRRLRCTEIFEGDCLISRLPDPVGRCCLMPNTGEKMITAVDCTIVRFNRKQVVPKYFNYFSQSATYLSLVESETSGTTRKRISRKKLGQIPLPVPPLSEQKRIVAILDEAFAAIATAKENAEKNLKNAREIFDSHIQNLFGNPPKGWAQVALADVCEFYNGQAHEQCIDEKGRYILINSKFISSDGIKFKRTDDALCPLFIGDIVFVMSDVPNGKALAKCFLVDKNDTYTLNQRIGVIRSSKFEKRFLLHQLNRNKYLLSFNNGENQTNLRKPDILKCPLLLPPVSEQVAVMETLDALSVETQRLAAIYEKKLKALEELKKAILEKAFSGKL